MILALLDAIQLLDKVAICKCAAHITNTDPASKGNRKADEEAKKAAQRPAENIKCYVICKKQPHKQKDRCDRLKMPFTMYSRTYMTDLKENPYCQRVCLNMLQY